MRGRTVVVLAVIGCGVALVVGAAPAPAANKIDETAAANIGKQVVLAAHPTAQDPALLEYKETTPQEGRLALEIKMKYFGKTTSAKYTATITVTIDTTKEPPHVVDLSYTDDNTIPWSRKKVKAAEGEIGKQLPKKL